MEADLGNPGTIRGDCHHNVRADEQDGLGKDPFNRGKSFRGPRRVDYRVRERVCVCLCVRVW